MLERLMNYYSACHCEKQSLVLRLTNDKIRDWVLFIYHQDSDTVIFDEDCTSLNLLCARAYIALEDWAREFPKLWDIENNL